MKKIILSAMAIVALAGCGKTTVKEVLVTTPEPAPTPITAEDMNKFDSYLNALYDNSAQARSWSEDDLLHLGTLVCQTFDNGGTLDMVLNIFSQNSSGRYDDELFSAIIAASVVHLCPEWTDYVSAQLS